MSMTNMISLPTDSEDSDGSTDSKIFSKPSPLKPGELASSCLWVGNVDPTVPEEDFRAVFEQYGPVSLLRIFISSKCAFVTFEQKQHALAALALEGKKLGSLSLTLNVGKASRHLWVGNIANNLGDKRLKAIFETYGLVESVRVLRANMCAFVNFVTGEDAMKAADALNGKIIEDQKITINFQWDVQNRKGTKKVALPQKKKNTSSPPTPPQVFLPGVISAPSLGLYYYNPVQPAHQPSTTEMSKNSSQDSRRSEHGSGSSSPIALSKYQDHFNAPSRQLFVGNLSAMVTHQDLHSFFSQYGTIDSIKAFNQRGYAFVLYHDLETAIRVRDHLSVYPPVIHGRPLSVNFGKSPDDTPSPTTTTVSAILSHLQGLSSIASTQPPSVSSSPPSSSSSVPSPPLPKASFAQSSPSTNSNSPTRSHIPHHASSKSADLSSNSMVLFRTQPTSSTSVPGTPAPPASRADALPQTLSPTVVMLPNGQHVLAYTTGPNPNVAASMSSSFTPQFQSSHSEGHQFSSGATWLSPNVNNSFMYSSHPHLTAIPSSYGVMQVGSASQPVYVPPVNLYSSQLGQTAHLQSTPQGFTVVTADNNTLLSQYQALSRMQARARGAQIPFSDQSLLSAQNVGIGVGQLPQDFSHLSI